MDRIDEWRIFTQVASRRSFAAAARAEGRSPQSVTRSVAALERRLGTRLLNRTTRSVSLTGEGERYLERGRRLLAEFDALEAPGEDQTAPLRGSLAVTAPVLFGRLHVLPVAAGFLASHPAVDLRLTLVDRVVSLAEEGIDLAIRIGALPDSALRVLSLGYVRLVVCASPGYLSRAGTPRAPTDLTRHACVSFSGTAPIPDRWSLASGGAGRREKGVPVRPRLVVNSADAAIDAAVAGLGLVRVLSYQVDHLVAARALRVVLARFEPPPVPVQMVHLPGVQPRLAATFAQVAAPVLRARLCPPTRPR